MVPLSRSASTSSSVEVGAVVDRREPELGGELDARAGAELVGVQPAPQAGGRPGLEDRAGLVGVERARLAEHVDPAGVRRGRLEHRAGDQVDVLAGSPSAGTTCAPRNVVSSVNCRATARLRASSCTVRP